MKVMNYNPVINNSSTYKGNADSAKMTDSDNFGIALGKKEIPFQNELLEKMGELLEDVEEIKGKIQEDLTLDNIMEYKDSIKLFLNFYVENMVGYEDVTLRHPKYGYSQRMTIIHNIEKEVNELDDVMSLIDTKTGHLDVLNKIGEINGMIIDLVL